MLGAIIILALAIMAGLWGYQKFLKPCGCKDA